jgi:hypothetical protein
MEKHVPARSRFIESPEHSSAVLEWFFRQELVAEQSIFDWGYVLNFKTVGELQYKPDGSIDSERSPVVTVHLPKARRQILWTVGEVLFTPSPLSQFPELASLRRSFLRWFEQYPLVYDNRANVEHEFSHYLEGSAANWGPIRAFPSGIDALKSGRYFISCRESDGALLKLCKKLRLRGINCAASD